MFLWFLRNNVYPKIIHKVITIDIYLCVCAQGLCVYLFIYTIYIVYRCGVSAKYKQKHALIHLKATEL